ncbi:MAG: hypothetical protein ACLVJ6_16445 [Merdibacter sp.]
MNLLIDIFNQQLGMDFDEKIIWSAPKHGQGADEIQPLGLWSERSPVRYRPRAAADVRRAGVHGWWRRRSRGCRIAILAISKISGDDNS